MLLGLDHGVPARPFGKGCLAEATSGLYAANDAAGAAYPHADENDDIETVVGVPRTQHRLPGLTIKPRGRAHYLADLGVGEIVEEAGRASARRAHRAAPLRARRCGRCG